MSTTHPQDPVAHRYAHPVDAVAALLLDPQFLTDRCEAAGERVASIDVNREGDETVVRTDRRIRRNLPGFLRRIFRSENKVTVVEHWRKSGDERHARFDVTVHGAPVSVAADVRLQPHADGSEYTVRYTFTVRVPLLGKRIASYAHGQAVDALAKDVAFTAGRLEGKP